jgi:hypothetical protein
MSIHALLPVPMLPIVEEKRYWSYINVNHSDYNPAPALPSVIEADEEKLSNSCHQLSIYFITLVFSFTCAAD